ncbi:ATP-dependent DNA helicase RecG [Nitrosomonas cryotolerans]|uniref:ATP-dependent DNA helicase RecG n=1 Tax=Nitrosomonas cryotolerans ATCC 49181 TaxID=1131553 RepID=A0A1N6HU80_9PROT|nr:ATP-dependent DNA helicase RecG [Nitrosomonas cryotolerans]SIO23296.1 ATP-dependent DNA helicase RecG [Nitrosomonas cryotolerans ATCC 49181]
MWVRGNKQDQRVGLIASAVIKPGNQSVRGKYSRLGIDNASDLILHFPIRYEDETHLCTIKDVSEGEVVQVEGVIVSSEIVSQPRRQWVCQVKDSSGMLFIRFLNFYSSQIKAYAIGTRVRLLGKIRTGFRGIEMIHPKCRIVQKGDPLANTLTPVCSVITGVSRKTLSKLIRQALSCPTHENHLSETLPDEILKHYRLTGFKESVLLLHHPPPDASVHLLQTRRHPAWYRIKFDELLAQQLSMRLHYHQRRRGHAPLLLKQNRLTRALLDLLGYELTCAQKRTVSEISRDLATPHPMQRLLQGDVGSGKIAVAALAALQAIENEYQVALMAPTEVLAEQHFQKLSGWFVPLGVTVVWLASSQKKKQRHAALTAIATGEAMLAIGTHALFQETVVFNRLGLVIMDEQHRFGVHQRLALRGKGAKADFLPHQLMMSATPIPRTLSMSYYADLDLSVIDELPPGRRPVITKLIAENRRDEIIMRIRAACREGRQAYWVCPLIEESETLQLKTVLETFERLNLIFPELKTGLIHGRLTMQEKSEVMARFKQGEIQLLIATSVIEVGVDIPNASLMVIEHAERMGLSQLHQLRGRIGRGVDAGICILLYQKPLSEMARLRLKIIFEHSDGFEIARQDLCLRGPGELLGARQSGLPMLRFVDLEQEKALLNTVKNAAEEILRHFPQFASQHIRRWLGEKHFYLRV